VVFNLQNLFLLAGWPVRYFNSIVKILVDLMISVWVKCLNWFDIAAQFVGYDDLGFVKLYNKLFKNRPAAFAIRCFA
jgi:hypothetical protein